MNRLSRLHGARGTEERYSVDQWAMDAGIAGMLGGVNTTWGDGGKTEPPASSFDGYVNGAFKRNSVVFAIIGVRTRIFTEARFQYQRLNGGRPGDLFGTGDLSILETPWTNGTTGDLLARMEQDASLAGNSYTARRTIRGVDQLRRMLPDRTEIICTSPSGDPMDLDAEPVGYVYWPKGLHQGRPETILAQDVAHYAPVPDPSARFRGMSWMTPALDEITADMAATRHKLKFFDNAATPNLAVSLDKSIPKADFLEFVEAMREHEGAENAYKTLWLAGGADVKVVGADLKQLDFKVTQGAGETRVAAASGVAPLIVGLSEGLGAATYSNYSQARRAVADIWARPSWRQAAGALESIVKPQPGSRLWYDDRDIPFLQEDEKDDAEIAQMEATTIRTLVDAGFEPGSVTHAVTAGDMSLLKHSGLYSVQLQAAGTQTPAPKGP